jgi:hypothetical protein
VSVYRVYVILFRFINLHKYVNRLFLNIHPAGSPEISVAISADCTVSQSKLSQSKSPSPGRRQMSYRLGMLNNDVLRRIFGRKGEDVTRVKDIA